MLEVGDEATVRVLGGLERGYGAWVVHVGEVNFEGFEAACGALDVVVEDVDRIGGHAGKRSRGDGRMSYRILAGDAIARLRELPGRVADCIVTDPPYGETSLAWDKRLAGWPSAAAAALKLTGSMWVFGSLRSHLMTAGEFGGWSLAQDIVWEKHNGSNFHADRFRRVHEIAAHYYLGAWSDVYNQTPHTSDAVAKVMRRKERPAHMGVIEGSTYVSHDGGPRIMRSVIYCRSEHGRAEHPTQKPTALLEHLIECSCPPGGMVLDPFCGSGSVGVAARRSGRSFIGIELNPEYVAMTERRLRDDAPLLRQVG